MPRCVLFVRLFSRPRLHEDAPEEPATPMTTNEKRVGKPRDWPAIFLTALRFLQFAYFAFAYHSLYHFHKSGYFREDGPWQSSPDQTRHTRRMMRWVRMQALMVLMYHALVLVVPRLLQLMRAAKRPLTGMVAVFGDGCAMMATLSMMVLLDTYHEGYCHRPVPRGADDTHGMFTPTKHRHDMSRHRRVCRSLDVVVGLAGAVILSHLVSAAVTTWRARQLSSTVCAKVEQETDVEQGIAREPAILDVPHPHLPSRPPTPQRQHSPPPPYHPIFPEQAQGQTGYVEDEERDPIPRGRPSVETTTSSIGLEHYLVSDGWRAPEEPPEYSSRPPSLHGSWV